jgi:Histidine kinase-, DNA gyrase B-, and HSP90-like ATPase
MIEEAVSDTGHGFSPEAQMNLFQTFFTTKETGMGVGLSIVGQSLKRTVAGCGRRPILRAAPRFISRCRALQPRTLTMEPSRKVYVIDDDPAMRDSLNFLLGSSALR